MTYDAKAMALQNAEFDAVAELAKQYRRIEMTAVVDDEYPRVRGDYERAMQALMAAVVANGRLPAPMTSRPHCSICNDTYEGCSKNYSGGWVGTPCPN